MAMESTTMARNVVSSVRYRVLRHTIEESRVSFALLSASVWSSAVGSEYILDIIHGGSDKVMVSEWIH